MPTRMPINPPRHLVSWCLAPDGPACHLVRRERLAGNDRRRTRLRVVRNHGAAAVQRTLDREALARQIGRLMTVISAFTIDVVVDDTEQRAFRKGRDWNVDDS